MKKKIKLSKKKTNIFFQRKKILNNNIFYNSKIQKLK